jgi:hypothetical protein
MPSLPPQAIPPDKRTPEPPPPFEDMLPSGIVVKWRMPDPFSIIAFDGVVPDPLTAATIALLREEKSYTPDSDPRKFRYDAQGILGMYGLAGKMLEEPRFNPSLEYGSNGTLGRRELGYMDAVHLYGLFRFTTRSAAIPDPGPQGIERTPDAPSDSEGVRADAGHAGGGE